MEVGVCKKSDADLTANALLAASIVTFRLEVVHRECCGISQILHIRELGQLYNPLFKLDILLSCARRGLGAKGWQGIDPKYTVLGPRCSYSLFIFGSSWKHQWSNGENSRS